MTMKPTYQRETTGRHQLMQPHDTRPNCWLN